MSNPPGRPSTFTAEIAQEICERLIAGESLRGICGDAHMPGKTTVLVWASINEEFRDQYARARELAGETDADDVAYYARQAATGDIEPAAATAAINGLKWSAGKRQPKKYGDNVQMRHSGAVGTFDAAKYSDDQLSELERVLLPIALSSGDAGGGEGGEGSTGG